MWARWVIASDFSVDKKGELWRTTTQPANVRQQKETRAISFDIQTSTQAWKLIEKDYTLRLSLVASDRATEHLMAWNAVFAEGRKRGSSAYCGPALVEIEIADEDKRAEWAYKTCCEIWEIQGRVRCRPFFRAILDFCLPSMFSVREGFFMYQLALHQTRTGAIIPQGVATIVGHMKRQQAGLLTTWNTRLEMAARDNDYEQQRRPGRSQDGGTLTAPLSANAAESAILRSLEQLEREGRKVKPGGALRKKSRSKVQLHKLGVIFGAIQSGLKAREYCVALDDRRLQPPSQWIEEGCPSTYPQAYLDAKWRQRIQDEKYKYRKNYEMMPGHERESLIQAASGTRRTRR